MTDLSEPDMRLLQATLPLAREAKDMRPQHQRLTEVCESYGLPVDVDALVTHLTNNIGMASYMKAEAEADQAEALQHVGWLSPGPNGSRLYPASIPLPGRLDVPVFIHDDWLDRVPNTERNKTS